VQVVLNPDNALSELKTNVGKLEPPFRTEIRSYVVNLAHADSVLMIFPRTRESHAVAKVENLTLNEPAPASGAMPVAVGETIFSVRVTAQDGSMLQYSIVAKRAGTP
jgi:hypothetical protein